MSANKKYAILIWTALTISLVLLAVSAYFYFLPDYEQRVYSTTVNITPAEDVKWGFYLDKNDTNLNFGNVFQGATLSRAINFENNNNYPVLIQITSKGTINQLLSYEDIVVVKANETKRLGFNIITTNETETGIYSGKIYLRYKRYG